MSFCALPQSPWSAPAAGVAALENVPFSRCFTNPQLAPVRSHPAIQTSEAAEPHTALWSPVAASAVHAPLASRCRILPPTAQTSWSSDPHSDCRMVLSAERSEFQVLD